MHDTKHGHTEKKARPLDTPSFLSCVLVVAVVRALVLGGRALGAAALGRTLGAAALCVVCIVCIVRVGRIICVVRTHDI